MTTIQMKVNSIERLGLIATCPRSGSSLLSRCFEASGGFFGTTTEGKMLNPLGFWENQDVNRIFQHAILKSGMDKGAVNFVKSMKANSMPQIELLKERMNLAFTLDGYKSGTAMFKHSRYMFFFDQIDKAFPDAVWILPIRPIKDITDSMMRGNNQITAASAKARAMAFLEGYAHISANAKYVSTIDTEKLVKEKDTSEFEETCNLLNLSFSRDKVLGCIDESLWKRSREEMKNWGKLPDGLYPIGQTHNKLLASNPEIENGH